MAEGDYELSIYRAADGKYVTYKNTEDANRLMEAPEYHHTESFPKKLVMKFDNRTPTAANNLLNSAFAAWDAGTAAVAMGDLIYFKQWPTGDSALREFFYGKIVDIRQSEHEPGVVIITAKDFLEIYENEKPSKLIHANYRDSILKDVTEVGFYRSIDGMTESDIAVPLAFIGHAYTDIDLGFGSGSGGADHRIWDTSTSTPLAQPFIAEGDAILGAYVKFDIVSSTSTVRCSIQTNKSDSEFEPSGVELGGVTVDHDAQTETFDFISSNLPIVVNKGRLYWLVIEVISGSGVANLDVETDTVATGSAITDLLHDTGGDASWATTISDEAIDGGIVYTEYQEVEPDGYIFDDPNDKAILLTNEGVVEAKGNVSYSAFYRGKVSCYYGTITHETICRRLIESVEDIYDDVDSDQDRTFGTFATHGKSLGDALRAVLDVFETGGNWSGYQHVMGHYLVGDPYTGSNYINTGKRKKTGDASSRTFAHPDDTATDDHHRILGQPQLKKTTRLRPTKVTFIGKGLDGNPIIATRHDLALSGSLGNLCGGFTRTEEVYDENLATMEDVDKAAVAVLDSFATNVWEGIITVSGCFPDLFEWIDTNDNFGSGDIITLYWGPLGISNTKFKVNSIIVRGNVTEIHISNRDVLIQNDITRSMGRGVLNESFLAPVGLVENFYVHVFDDSVITEATVYMALLDGAGADITDLERALCTKFTNTDRNLVTYHAEFEKWMGYTPSGAPVDKIRLLDAKTGGNTEGTVELTTTGPPDSDHTFYKWKTMRVIVDYTCKGS